MPREFRLVRWPNSEEKLFLLMESHCEGYANTLTFRYEGSTAYAGAATNAILPTIWQHVAATYNPTTPEDGLTVTGESTPLFDAVEKQLGLKLEAFTVFIPVIMVDGVNEKRYPNPAEIARCSGPSSRTSGGRRRSRLEEQQERQSLARP